MDGLAGLSAPRGIVRERVRRSGRRARIVATSPAATSTTSTTTIAAAAEATTATVATTAVASARAKAAATASEASTTTESAARRAAEAGSVAGEAVFTNLERPALPLVPVELGDGVASILGIVEGDDAGSLGPTVGAEMDVGADDGALLSCIGRYMSTTALETEELELWATHGHTGAGRHVPAPRKRSLRSCQPTV